MKDRKLCKKCKWHGMIGARDSQNIENVICDYAALYGRPALHKGKHGDVVDIRGNKFNKCKLFEKGEALRRQKEPVIHRTIKSKWKEGAKG